MSVLEICAGAGGQSLGLEQAGFVHTLAVELDAWAAQTLRANLGSQRVREGDVADRDVWKPEKYAGVDLLAGGVPCPPFSVAGKQRGATDERDLFAWSIELAAKLRPRAVLLENVRGLSMPRFAAYRQRVIDRLNEVGYVADWRLLQASNFGIPQLRPRFVLIALRPKDWVYFSWPEGSGFAPSVGEALRDMMAAGGWLHADDWAATANAIAPTLVGGSKKHGGADLGPSRAKAAWRALAVDGHGLADAPPGPDAPHWSVKPPRLTVEMAARLQGWSFDNARHRDWIRNLAGRKTARYRQIGNAFPPPIAKALGVSLARALHHKGIQQDGTQVVSVHDPIYQALAAAKDYVSAEYLLKASGSSIDEKSFAMRMAHLTKDFELETRRTAAGNEYRLVNFRAFTGQADHMRHGYFERSRNLVS